MQNDEITVFDLFNGIDGFTLGFQRAGGFRTVASCDNNKYANQIHYKNYGRENHYSGDIRRVNPETIPDFDLLCAGFPCQAFSVAGKRKGFRDPRGTLFYEILRITRIKKPKMLLLENVKGLLNHDRGATFATILRELGRLNYWCEYQVLNSKYFGVPQTRERVFIIGHLREQGTSPLFPITATNRTNITPSKTKVSERGILMIQTAHSHKTRWGDWIKDQDYSDTLDEWGSLGVAIPKVSNTLCDGWWLDTSHHDKPLCHYRVRLFTPTECERLQGFPDCWTEGISDSQRRKCLGRAVTVNVIEFLGRLIHSSLSKARK